MFEKIFKTTLKFIITKLFRIEVVGTENFYKAGKRVMIVANHLSFIDGLIIALFLPEKPMFAINTHSAKQWYVKPFLKLIDAFTMDSTNPMSVKHMITELKKDRKCVIFPEGRITVTGSLMKIYEGPGLIADKSDATILPVRIDGAQYSPFSRLKGKVKIRLFPKITIHILEPRKLDIDKNIKGRKRRQVISTKLYDLMTEMLFITSNINKTLFRTLLEQKHLHGRNHLIIEDPTRKPMSYGKLVTSSFVLGKKLVNKTEQEQCVGVFLPNMNTSVVTFFALQAFGQVPAMLNFSSGIKNLISVCETAQIKQVITSKAFIEKGNFEAVIEAMLAIKIKIVYLEDVAKKISFIDKAIGFIASYFAESYHNKIQSQTAKDNAVVLFTSGSEGLPKGVVLSHNNIQANYQQIASCVDFGPSDIVFNAMPIFHSLGLTAGLLLPILSGVRTFLYPSPLHYRVIPELVYDTNSTIMFGTDTFLSGYARYADAYDFYSLRYIFAGAEKLKDDTRKLWTNKYGVRIFEGYGATETAPVISINTPMYNRIGSVGKLLPGITAEFEPVAGIEKGAKLIVSGPNIMKGYYLSTQPGVLIPAENSRYDTGDIVSIDEDGFLSIEGRAKRFAKIAGEMISLTAVESYITQLWENQQHAIINIPDASKGEALVLFTDYPQANREPILSYFRKNGISELAIPKIVKIIDKIPLLGSGKIDYMSLVNLLKAY